METKHSVEWLGLNTRVIDGLSECCAVIMENFEPNLHPILREDWIKNGPPVPSALEWRAPEIKEVEK